MVIAIPSRCLADEAFRQSSGVIEKWVRMRIRVKADDVFRIKGLPPIELQARSCKYTGPNWLCCLTCSKYIHNANRSRSPDKGALRPPLPHVSHPPSSPPHASRPVRRSYPARRTPRNVLLSSVRLHINDLRDI